MSHTCISTTSLTTADVLKLENAGGIISQGTYPLGLGPTNGFGDWLRAMPNVNPSLVNAWHDFCHAKERLLSCIEEFTGPH